VNGETVDIFVCHSGADDDWVRMLATRIEKETLDGTAATRRLKVFNGERDIGVGDVFVFRMLEGVAAARYVALVMSPEFFQSRYTSIEAAKALQTKPLIPIFLRDTPIRQGKTLTEVPFLFREFTYFDFRQPCDFERQFAALIAHIRKAAPNPDTNAAEDHGLMQLMQTALTIARQVVPLPVASMAEVNQARPPVGARPFTMLEEAFRHVRSRIGVVFASRPAPRLLGCAWAWQDKHVLCASQIGELVRKAIHDGCRVELSALHPCAEPWATPILTVSESNFSELAILHAHPLGRVPVAPQMVWADLLHPLSLAEPFGAVGLRSNDDGPMPVSTLWRVQVRDWCEPGGALQIGPEESASYAIASGTPLFDRTARVIGFIAHAEAGRITAVPLSRRDT